MLNSVFGLCAGLALLVLAIGRVFRQAPKADPDHEVTLSSLRKALEALDSWERTRGPCGSDGSTVVPFETSLKLGEALGYLRQAMPQTKAADESIESPAV